MPGRDGTGPMGIGPMTGRGLGPCRTNKFKYGAGLLLCLGLGLTCRRGLGRRYRTKSNLLTRRIANRIKR